MIWKLSQLYHDLFAQKSKLFLVANWVIVLCTIIIVFAIFFDFVVYHYPSETKKKTRSWVETGSMFVYFFFYYLLLTLEFGKMKIQSNSVISMFYIIGSVILILGCAVNVIGRFSLKSNWANQVTIYHHQTLVTGGVYRLVRHPLYASIIWMLIGGCLVYFSYLALLSVFFIFVPMMRYRAKQEEELLRSEFAEYELYKKRVWMFFPKIILSNGKV